jgi:hypothetical protein
VSMSWAYDYKWLFDGVGGAALLAGVGFAARYLLRSRRNPALMTHAALLNSGAISDSKISQTVNSPTVNVAFPPSSTAPTPDLPDVLRAIGEARHLQEMKDGVIRPIRSWIDLTVSERFTGKTPRLLTAADGYGGKPRRVSHTVDDPFNARRRLATDADHDAPDPLTTWVSTDSGRISEYLYSHAKQEHFPTELKEFDSLLGDVRLLTGALVTFANVCAGDIASIEIPPAVRSEDENRMGEWANPHLFMVECVQSFLLGKRDPVFRLEPFGSSCGLKGQGSEFVAKAVQADKLRRWHLFAYEQVLARWQGSDLPQGIGNLLRSSESLRRTMDKLLFTHSLPGNCDLVSGKQRPTAGQL